MKKIIMIVLCIIFILISGCFSICLYTSIKLSKVKSNILKKNPEVHEVVSINSSGQWGEWFSYYSAVVEIDGSKFRVWPSEDGDISDYKERINE
ncbi:hypothetical protein D9X91_13455 [Falsibacillus albus]|uniref:DUF3139 domain-containing protein n=1 Tax=Falsibacillus albus TaxID=2478915 RepID=A0A3L7JWB5_9BACI|nr:hypothetical protein D9X91_13455 [Falsibacillus albus]